jgi:hypothetical protein
MRLGGDFFDLEGWAFVMSHLYACNDNDAPGHAFQGSHLCHDGERTGAFCRCMFCMVWESITDNNQRGVCQDLAKQRMKGSTDGQDSIDNGVFCPSKVDTRCTTWVGKTRPSARSDVLAHFRKIHDERAADDKRANRLGRCHFPSCRQELFTVSVLKDCLSIANVRLLMKHMNSPHKMALGTP